MADSTAGRPDPQVDMAPGPVDINPPLGVVEVDEDTVESDSAYGSELSTFTSSLTSSVLQYRQENGRTYHGYRDGRYLLPNDDPELDRLDMIHEMTLTIMDRKLFAAPVDSVQRVLDLGTGTGIWAIDFADQFPSAEVVANGLSPSQPQMVPPNLAFHVEDIEDTWIHPVDSFDYIHARYLAISIQDFPRLLQQCYTHVKPGGWVEFQDWDPLIRSDDGTTKGTAIEKYCAEVMTCFETTGYPSRPGRDLETWFRVAGFEEVKVQRYIVPLGTWAKNKHYKRIGAWFLLQSEIGLESSAMAVLTREAGWSPLSVQVLVAKAKEDARNPRIHGYCRFYVAYGRKPKTAS